MANRAMRDSGVQWIAGIPEDWEVVALKRVATLNDDSLSNNTPDDYQFKYVDIGSVSFEKGIHSKELTTFKEAPSRARRLVRKNDVIISTVRTYLKAIAIISDEDELVVSTGFAVIRPRKLCPLFLNYAVKSHYFTERVRAYSNGVAYPSINASELISMKVVSPNVDEQQKIAAFLDEKISHIDNIIEDTKKSIENLKAYKQSFITETVTKGLNPDIEMKDSEVEWIGKIPKHWTVTKVKNFVSIKNGKDNKVKDGEIPVYGSGGIFGKTNQIMYGDPSVLLGRKGTIDSPKYVEKPFWAVDTTFYTIVKPNVFLKFFYYLMKSLDYKKYTYGSAIPSMSQSILNEIKLPYPNEEEQKQISNYLDEKTEQIDSMINQKYTLVKEFESYKKSLIYEYVTGKKEVK